MAYPLRICFPCEECGKWTLHELTGEHGPYVMYMCTECGKYHLVHKAIVWNYVDMSLCGRPI